MKLPKLPAPPLPNALQGRPQSPAEDRRPGPVEQVKEAGISAVDWVDERTSIAGGLRWVMFRKVPKGTNWFYTLGSATLFAFVAQAITGVFLAMYYTPSPTEAYASITHLTNDVFLGEFVRGMHKWGATVMIIDGTGPVLGPYLADFLRAGAEFESTTLSRFYAMHMLLIPGAIIALIGAHLFLVVKLGTTAPPWVRAEIKPKALRTEKVG